MARYAYTVVITPPGGERREITVKKSTQIKLEERLGVPILAHIAQGYAYAPERLCFEVAQDAGAISKDLSFEEVLDSDDEWFFDLIPPSVEEIAVDGQGNA